MLGVIDSFKILEKFPLAKWKIISNTENLKDFDFPCYLKADFSGHKTEEGAVLKCKNFEEAKKNFEKLKQKFNSEIILQENIEGMEMIVGLKRDKVFGKLVLFGFGGTNAETLKDIQFRAVPFSKKEAESALKKLKLYPTLYKRKKYAIENFIEIITDVQKLPLKEMDLNPVILNEQEAKIVDARIEV